MSTLGERKCALLLLSMRGRDRRQLLARLPESSARSIRQLIKELESLPYAVGDLGEQLLVDEVRGLTASTSLDLDQLVSLSEQLPTVWFAKVMSVWTGVDRNFCLSLLDSAVSVEVKQELARMRPLPAKLAEALRAETAILASRQKEAA